MDRYKHLLIKQRDIMIALTSRLTERDDTITQLQQELDAYDTRQMELEDEVAASPASLACRSLPSLVCSLPSLACLPCPALPVAAAPAAPRGQAGAAHMRRALPPRHAPKKNKGPAQAFPQLPPPHAPWHPPGRCVPCPGAKGAERGAPLARTAHTSLPRIACLARVPPAACRAHLSRPAWH